VKTWPSEAKAKDINIVKAKTFSSRPRPKPATEAKAMTSKWCPQRSSRPKPDLEKNKRSAWTAPVPSTKVKIQKETNPNDHDRRTGKCYEFVSSNLVLDFSVTSFTQCYLQTTPYLPLLPSRRASPPFGRYSLRLPTEG